MPPVDRRQFLGLASYGLVVDARGMIPPAKMQPRSTQPRVTERGAPSSADEPDSARRRADSSFRFRT